MTEFEFDPDVYADELRRADANFTVGSRLLYEDSLVRVWDITLEPGERLPFHRHRTTYLYRCQAGSLTRVRFPDGRGILYPSEPDEVHVHEIGPDDDRDPRPRERGQDDAGVYDDRASVGRP